MYISCFENKINIILKLFQIKFILYLDFYFSNQIHFFFIYHVYYKTPIKPNLKHHYYSKKNENINYYPGYSKPGCFFRVLDFHHFYLV